MFRFYSSSRLEKSYVRINTALRRFLGDSSVSGANATETIIRPIQKDVLGICVFSALVSMSLFVYSFNIYLNLFFLCLIVQTCAQSAVTFGLGVWQYQRYNWKIGLIADIKNKLNLPIVPLPDDLGDLELME